MSSAAWSEVEKKYHSVLLRGFVLIRGTDERVADVQQDIMLGEADAESVWLKFLLSGPGLWKSIVAAAVWNLTFFALVVAWLGVRVPMTGVPVA